MKRNFLAGFQAQGDSAGDREVCGQAPQGDEGDLDLRRASGGILPVDQAHRARQDRQGAGRVERPEPVRQRYSELEGASSGVLAGGVPGSLRASFRDARTCAYSAELAAAGMIESPCGFIPRFRHTNPVPRAKSGLVTAGCIEKNRLLPATNYWLLLAIIRVSCPLSTLPTWGLQVLEPPGVLGYPWH